ncbi:MAG: hypothetical protein ABEI11_00445 [Haloarculaceae archaeon]
MNWRCTECGRIHRTNGHACDCGSESYERAVVQHVKRCTECGEPAGRNERICSECGFGTFEPISDEPTAGELETSYIQWRCVECGREYPKNNPPCDRCGGMEFEREEYGDEQFDMDEYVERGGGGVPWRLVAALAAIVVGVVIVGMVL